MCRKPPLAATAACLAVLASAACAAPALAWPFGPAKPKAAPAQGQAANPATPPPKPTAVERAAADRMAPLARSVFWSRVVEADPTDADAGVHLAASLRTLGRYSEAADAVGKVLILSPDDLEALLESARDAVSAGKGFYALAPLRHAQTLAPRDWRVYSLFGLAHDQNQQPELARQAYGQALQLSPGNPAVLSNLGLWYATHGQASQGEPYLRQAAASPAATAQERQNLALVLGMEGKFSEAASLLHEDLPPEAADANLAYLHAIAARGAAAPVSLPPASPGG